MTTVENCLKKNSIISVPELSLKLHAHLFDLLLEVAENTGVYLEEQKKDESYFTSDAQVYLRGSENMIRLMISICLAPVIRGHQRIWTKMRDFCLKWPAKQMLALFLQKPVVDATSNLIESLAMMPEKDYSVLCDPMLIPFEGLPMKKEFSMQVLYNSYYALVSATTEEAQNVLNTSIYKEVYKMSIYQSFEIWINILKLIQIQPGFKHKQVLLDYIKSKLSGNH